MCENMCQYADLAIEDSTLSAHVGVSTQRVSENVRQRANLATEDGTLSVHVNVSECVRMAYLASM